jgi:hypothetical protein
MPYASYVAGWKLRRVLRKTSASAEGSEEKGRHSASCGERETRSTIEWRTFHYQGEIIIKRKEYDFVRK